MSTLVLHTHPLEDSFSAHLRDVVCEALTASEVEFDLVRFGQGEEPQVDELQLVDHLIAVYPTWWGGLPATLLDWVQRTLCPVIDDQASTARSPFSGIQRITVVTTHGSSKLMNRAQGQPGRLTWSRVIVPQCAAGVSFDWVALYTIDRTDHDQRAAFADRVRATFTNDRVRA